MSVPQQKEAVEELESRGRSRKELREYYERQWEREVEEANREALLVLAREVAPGDERDNLETLDLD